MQESTTMLNASEIQATHFFLSKCLGLMTEGTRNLDERTDLQVLFVLPLIE